MGYEDSAGNIEEKMGCLFSMENDRTIKMHVDDVDISNGLAWSADRKTMYYIDSMPHKVYAFDFDIHAGTLSE